MGHYSLQGRIVLPRALREGADKCHPDRGHTVPLLHDHLAKDLLQGM